MDRRAAQSVLIVAEPGGTHEGKLDRMLTMIDVAKEAGSDVVKFGWVSDPAKMCKRRGMDEDPMVHVAFPACWHVELWERCKQSGIEYACTTFLPEDLLIVSIFVSRFKVASFEASDRAFLRAHESYGKPIMVSTGMQGEEELAWLLRRRKKNPNVQLLHCASAYPAPVDALNLAVIRKHGLDGFSDHSGQVITGGLAVAAGARIVEAHFRLDDCDHTNPDFPHSLTPADLREYVAGVRWAEKALGNGVKQCQPSEEPNKKYRVGGGR